MIRKAIAASPSLKDLDIEVFAQGSFRNITNIAQESDIDISVCLREAWYYEIPEGTKASDFNISPTGHNYETYRQNVIDALSEYFGSDVVHPAGREEYGLTSWGEGTVMAHHEIANLIIAGRDQVWVVVYDDAHPGVLVYTDRVRVKPRQREYLESYGENGHGTRSLNELQVYS